MKMMSKNTRIIDEEANGLQLTCDHLKKEVVFMWSEWHIGEANSKHSKHFRGNVRLEIHSRGGSQFR